MGMLLSGICFILQPSGGHTVPDGLGYIVFSSHWERYRQGGGCATVFPGCLISLGACALQGIFGTGAGTSDAGVPTNTTVAVLQVSPPSLGPPSRQNTIHHPNAAAHVLLPLSQHSRSERAEGAVGYDSSRETLAREELRSTFKGRAASERRVALKQCVSLMDEIPRRLTRYRLVQAASDLMTMDCAGHTGGYAAAACREPPVQGEARRRAGSRLALC